MMDATTQGSAVNWLQTMPKIQAPPAPPPRPPRRVQTEFWRMISRPRRPTLAVLRHQERAAYAALVEFIEKRGTCGDEDIYEVVQEDTLRIGIYMNLADDAVKFEDVELASRIWDYIPALQALARAEKSELLWALRKPQVYRAAMRRARR